MQVELVPGGRDRPVTSGNVVEYIHRVADYRLNQQVRSIQHVHSTAHFAACCVHLHADVLQIRTASEAFLRGFHDLIELDWVSKY